MMDVEYRAVDSLPGNVPAAIAASGGRVVILIDRNMTVDQVCEALTPLITEHARSCWTPHARIA